MKVILNQKHRVSRIDPNKVGSTLGFDSKPSLKVEPLLLPKSKTIILTPGLKNQLNLSKNNLSKVSSKQFQNSLKREQIKTLTIYLKRFPAQLDSKPLSFYSELFNTPVQIFQILRTTPAHKQNQAFYKEALLIFAKNAKEINSGFTLPKANDVFLKHLNNNPVFSERNFGRKVAETFDHTCGLTGIPNIGLFINTDKYIQHSHHLWAKGKYPVLKGLCANGVCMFKGYHDLYHKSRGTGFNVTGFDFVRFLNEVKTLDVKPTWLASDSSVLFEIDYHLINELITFLNELNVLLDDYYREQT